MPRHWAFDTDATEGTLQGEASSTPQPAPTNRLIGATQSPKGKKIAKLPVDEKPA